MLKKFVVTNFKNFKKRTEFDISNPYNYEFNSEIIKNGYITKGIILGKNGSGKTNLGLAIFDIVVHMTSTMNLVPKKYLPYLNQYSNMNYAEFEYYFDFDGDELIYKYAKSDPYALVYESLYINTKEVINFNYKENKGFSKLKGSEILDLKINNNEKFGPKLSRVRYLGDLAILEENEENKTFKSFINFVKTMLLFYSLDDRGFQGYKNVAEIFTQVIVREGKTKEFERFLKNNGIDYDLVERPNGGVLDIYCKFPKGEYLFHQVASTGTESMALFYYWYIEMEKASFVYMDEFDAFYHFELAYNIAKLVREVKGTQIFISTHNTDLISNDLLRPDVYFEIEDGEIKSLSDKTDKEIRLAHNIQKMYKAGAFNE